MRTPPFYSDDPSKTAKVEHGKGRPVSGAVPQLRRRRRRRALIAAAIVVLILVGGVGGSALAYTTIKNQAAQLQAQLTVHLQMAQGELEAAKTSLRLANDNHDAKLTTEAKAHFTAAAAQFTAARSIADNSQLLGRLEQAPEIGNLVRARHVAVDAIADMGLAISDAGQELADLAGQILKPSTGGQSGRTLLTVLALTSRSIVKVRADLDRAEKAAARVDITVLPAGQQGTLIKARGTITSALSAIDEFALLVPVLTDVLGGNGTRTYLIEQVNPAELRPGGGFIGTYSVLQTNRGALKLIKTGPSPDLSEPRALVGQPGYVVPPGPFHESLLLTQSWSFMDSNFYPDFPSNAKAAEGFAQPRLGAHIDGVISMDPYMVAKMLELTGPLPVPGYGITVDGKNFIPLVIQHDLAQDAIHKAILSAIAGPLMSRLSTLPADRWPALLRALNDLAAARHLQAYFNNVTVENELNQIGWSGTLNPIGIRDYMMEVESNLGATKANYFVTRHFTVELTRKGGTLRHKVTVDLVDNMPFNYRPNEFYKAYLQLYVSATASSRSDNLRGTLYPNPAPPLGLRLIDGWVPLFHGYGHSAQAVFVYDTPWQADGRGESQIYWQKQPGTLNDAVTVKWNDGNGHAYSVSSDLSQDRVILFSAKGISFAVGHSSQAQLPSLSLG